MGQYNNDLMYTIEDFISEVQSEISISCSLPYNIPEKEIHRIITQSKKWFYTNYDDATEERYYVIPREAFNHRTYEKHRYITMPDCVTSIFRIQKIGGKHFNYSYDGTKDMAIDKLFSSTSYVGDDIMYYTINLYWYDTIKQVTDYSIAYNYNRLTKKLFFPGETPSHNIVASCDVQLPIEYLIQDELFFRYVVARCKKQLSRILGTFNFNLVGNITLNYDLIQTEGDDEIDAVKEEIKNLQGADYFFMTNGD